MGEGSKVDRSGNRVTDASDAPGARTPWPPMIDDEHVGGDPVCWAHLCCQECAVMLDGTADAVNCSRVD